MQNLIVTAYLLNGFISSDKWSPSLDNILAYWHLKYKLSDAEFVAGCANLDNDVIVDDLPVGIEKFNNDWWYHVSSPIMEVSERHGIHIHRRFDGLYAEKYMLSKRGRIQVQTGQHKNTRIKNFISITDKVIWHINGDQSRIEQLLSQCSHIGARISGGFGKVVKWEVIKNEDESLSRFHRPLPLDFAENQSIHGVKILWGYRPNVRKKENQTLCVMP